MKNEDFVDSEGKSDKFRFLKYSFDKKTGRAEFSYLGADGSKFTEIVDFLLEMPGKGAKTAGEASEGENGKNGSLGPERASWPKNGFLGSEETLGVDSGKDSSFDSVRPEFVRNDLLGSEEALGADFGADSRFLDSALRLCFFVIGTSYYKAHPTPEVDLGNFQLSEMEAEFLNQVYQEGLSQFAYENQLMRADLGHFYAERATNFEARTLENRAALERPRSLVLESGGKDSLLTATLLKEKGLQFTPLYITSSRNYPKILDSLGTPVVIRRKIDVSSLKKAGGMNGHVPVTYINSALAMVQAILLGFTNVIVSVGQEGNESHSEIRAREGEKLAAEDLRPLAVNHEWSKTWAAEELFSDYVATEISPDFRYFSLLRPYSELKIAEMFAEKCWGEFGHRFSSCNRANYGLGVDNSELKWCGKCAKCANTFLVFAPYVPAEELKLLFSGRDLFSDPELVEIFKGLLGIEGVSKPFECVAETAELRYAYHHKLSGYADLPFEVPEAEFEPDSLGPANVPPRLEAE